MSLGACQLRLALAAQQAVVAGSRLSDLREALAECSTARRLSRRTLGHSTVKLVDGDLGLLIGSELHGSLSFRPARKVVL